MKDYCDLIAISRVFEIDGQSLTEAIRATFQRRGTPLPDDIPTGLSEEFSEDAGKQRQWIGYLSRMKLESVPRSLSPTRSRSSGDSSSQLWRLHQASDRRQIDGGPQRGGVSTDNRGRERIPIPAVEYPVAKVAPVPISACT